MWQNLYVWAAGWALTMWPLGGVILLVGHWINRDDWKEGGGLLCALGLIGLLSSWYVVPADWGAPARARVMERFTIVAKSLGLEAERPTVASDVERAIGSPKALLPSLDVEGVAEDVALYVRAGQVCELPSTREVNVVAAFLNEIDEPAFDRGMVRGVALFAGLEKEGGKQGLCVVVGVSRRDAERRINEAAAAIRRYQGR